MCVGGTGGSDTAGLGGRGKDITPCYTSSSVVTDHLCAGGPYRLDGGHTVHQVRTYIHDCNSRDNTCLQVSDEEKKISEAAKQQARKMAKVL
jgi:hypothetical protein